MSLEPTPPGELGESISACVEADEEQVFERSELPDECLRESEPNDLSEDAAYEYLGLVTGVKPVLLCGTISQSGLTDEGYFTGDVEYVLFELIDTLDVELSLISGTAADWEMQLSDGEGNLIDYTGDGPISERLHPGLYIVFLATYSGSSMSYELVVTADWERLGLQRGESAVLPGGDVCRRRQLAPPTGPRMDLRTSGR